MNLGRRTAEGGCPYMSSGARGKQIPPFGRNDKIFGEGNSLVHLRNFIHSTGEPVRFLLSLSYSIRLILVLRVTRYKFIRR
jgi:hypothetical protein